MSRTDDLVEINQVASLYAHLIDTRDFARMGEVYAADAVYQSADRGEHRGLPAIVEYLSSHQHPFTHSTTNVYVEFNEDGNAANGVAKFLVLLRDLSVAAGDYKDHWIRTSGGWRLVHRQSSFRMGAHTVDDTRERVIK